MNGAFFEKAACAAALLALLAGCGPGSSSEDEPLVEVDGHSITAADLRHYETRLPKFLKAEGKDSTRAYLQGLVDRYLMEDEARKRGLDRNAALRHRLESEANKKLIQQISKEQIDDKLKVKEEELKEAYDHYNVGWRVWPAHILSATEEDARQVIHLLEEGADFAELARRRSLADDSIHGGDLGRFFSANDAIPVLREATFELEVGQISEPIKTKDGWEVVKIIDRERSSLGQMRPEISRQLIQRKWALRRAEYVAELKKRWEVHYHPERVHRVLEALRGAAALSAGEEAQPLISYTGGALSMGDLVKGVKSMQKGAPPADSLQLFTLLERWVLPDTLMVLAARAQGRHQDPKLLAWKEKRFEEMMVRQLYKELIVPRVEVQEEEVRRFYDEHLDEYAQLPGPMEITEVLVESEEEAREIYQKARAGARLEELAVEHSVRPGMQPVQGHTHSDSGHIHIASMVSSPYRKFFGEANHKEVGKIQEPMPVQDRYSVFRLDQPFDRQLIPYRKIRQHIRKNLQRQREAVAFAAYIDSLRAVHGGQIHWYEDNLNRMLASR